MPSVKWTKSHKQVKFWLTIEEYTAFREACRFGERSMSDTLKDTILVGSIKEFERRDNASTGEGYQHFAAKNLIAQVLTATGLEPMIEYSVPTEAGYNLSIDVAVPALKLAIEILASPPNRGNARYHKQRLENMGWQVVEVTIDKVPEGKTRPIKFQRARRS